MSDTKLILILLSIMFVFGIIIIFIIPEAKAIPIPPEKQQEDQMKLCDFVGDCFTVNIDDFFTKKQMDTIDESLMNMKKIENLSRADRLSGYLNDTMDRQLFCVEGEY